MSTFQGVVRSLSGVYSQGPATVVNVSGTTLTIDPSIHAGRILNITAASTTITLPAVNVSTNPVQSGPGQDPNTLNNQGIVYQFFIPSTATAVKVITNSGSDFLLGSVILSTAGGAASMYTANGSSIRSVNLNGTTTGGIAGSYFTVVVTGANTYMVQGQLIGSGTLATPFATS